jgi:hypothetical protein
MVFDYNASNQAATITTALQQPFKTTDYSTELNFAHW